MKLTAKEKEYYHQFLIDRYGMKDSFFFNVCGQLEVDENGKERFVKYVKHVKEQPKESDFRDHIEGKKMISLAPLFKGKRGEGRSDQDWYCRFSVIDVDDVVDEVTQKPINPRATEKRACEIYNYATNALKLNCYIVKSRSKGYHIVFFYETPIRTVSVLQIDRKSVV